MVDTTAISETELSVGLPDFFPQQNLVVEREEHRFEVFQRDFDTEPQLEYELQKAPIEEIIRVTGIFEAQTIEFTKGEDYTLSEDTERIVWNNDARTPEAGTTFFVTYESDSILKRYLSASDEELAVSQQAIVDSATATFIDTASGEELDRLGALFGDVIGARRGRVDSDYRAYLKSVVQSFVSRGTISGIKTAVAAATGADIENISINENFDDNTYEVVVIPETPIAGSTIEEISQIADPSGVEQSLTRFIPDEDEVGADDAVFIKDGIATDDTMSVTDGAIFVNPNKFSAADALQVDDANAIDANKYLSTDSVGILDEAVPGNNSVTDATGMADVIENAEPVNKNAHRWEDTSDPDVETRWTFFEWTEIIDLLREVTDDEIASDDAVTIPPKDAIVSETGYTSDATEIRFNVNYVDDTAFTDDAVTIPPTDGVTADTGYSDDAVTDVSETLVAWDTQDWDTLEWTIEHN